MEIPKNLQASYYFSNTKFLVLFKDINYVWEALPKIKEFIQKELEKAGKGPDDVLVGKGTNVHPNAVIEGPTIIGKNCEIRPGTYIRGQVYIGDNCVIRSEIKNSVIMDNTSAAHLSYMGDSIIGSNVNLGALTVLSNLKNDESEVKVRLKDNVIETGLIKFGAIVGDNVKTGCMTEAEPGTLIGKNTLVYGTAKLRGFYEENKIIKVRSIIGIVDKK